MKVVSRILIALIAIPYLIVVIFLTACLLNYNDYNLTEFGRDTLIIMGKDEVGDYKNGDLLVVYKNANKDIEEGDYIFFYDTKSKESVVSYAKVEKKEDVTRTETTYTVEGDYKVSSEYVIGKDETVKVYSKVGGVLKLLESRWGFLIFVIFPILLVFMYEVYALLMELKEGKKVEQKG